jgi:hypothetical protein
MRGLVLGLVLVASVARAGGPVTVTFDQLADCAVVGGWELAYERAATAGATPGTAALGASIPKGATCGANTSGVVNSTGVGNMRFWLRAVDTTGAIKSAYSNFVEAALPFASPVLKSVGN